MLITQCIRLCVTLTLKTQEKVVNTSAVKPFGAELLHNAIKTKYKMIQYIESAIHNKRILYFLIVD